MEAPVSRLAFGMWEVCGFSVLDFFVGGLVCNLSIMLFLFVFHLGMLVCLHRTEFLEIHGFEPRKITKVRDQRYKW